MGDESVAPRLGHHAIARIDQNDRKVAGARARHQIARVLLVPGRVRNDELSFRRRKIAVSNINGDTLLALRPQAIGQQRKIDALATTSFVFALCPFDLVFKCTLSLDEQAANQGGFPIVDVAGRSEAENVTAQKYPSRFLSSMVLAP